MDGVSAIKLVRAMPTVGSIPILILTAKDKEARQGHRGLTAELMTIWSSPSVSWSLGARIRSLLRRSGTAIA